MTIQADTMGEQPIFTCKAHVFHIDPKTKRWATLQGKRLGICTSFFPMEKGAMVMNIARRLWGFWGENFNMGKS
jgi:hypothetical protein